MQMESVRRSGAGAAAYDMARKVAEMGVDRP
jgi:hypothetical protein